MVINQPFTGNLALTDVFFFLLDSAVLDGDALWSSFDSFVCSLSSYSQWNVHISWISRYITLYDRFVIDSTCTHRE